jgi:hypothetical protein
MASSQSPYSSAELLLSGLICSKQTARKRRKGDHQQ